MKFQFNRLDIREEDIFAELHHYLLRKNNRYMTNDEIIEKTGVSGELLAKWAKNGKFKASIFPNIGAPCERCGTVTQTRLCLNCAENITGTLAKEKRDREWFKKINQKQRSTYHYR